MDFFVVQNLKDGLVINSSGIDIATMSKAFKIIEKNSELKTLDDMMEKSFVFLEKTYSFKNEENIVFQYKDKKLNFAIVDKNKILEISDADADYFCAIHEQSLKAKSKKEDIELIISQKSLVSSNEVENKALSWLENGRVGLSSATMCAAFFPQLKNHYKFKNKIDEEGNVEINWPHDNGDFHRCVSFLEAVPEVKSRMSELKTLSNEWSSLVDKWGEIEDLVNKKDTENSYKLIKSCISGTKKLKI